MDIESLLQPEPEPKPKATAPDKADAGSPPGDGQDTDRPHAGQLLMQLQQLRLSYGANIILDRVNFDIHEGEFWCFLGSNGQGKTTLIKALLGAVKPRFGVIGHRSDLFRKRRVSYVPQRLELNPVLPTSVTEFITSGLVGLQVHSEQRHKRLVRVLDLMGLRSLQEKNYWTLSGGQRQRALVARALIRDPSLLIVDEPTAGLDLAAARQVLTILRDLHTTYKVTVIFVTHDLQISADYATHVALFKDGKVTAGPKHEVMTSQNMRHTFGVPIDIKDHGQGKLEVVTNPLAFGGVT